MLSLVLTAASVFRVELALDRLVAATRHDVLSAQHFRSIDPQRPAGDRPDPEEAEINLIDWTLENLEKLEWKAEAMVFRPPGAGGG